MPRQPSSQRPTQLTEVEIRAEMKAVQEEKRSLQVQLYRIIQALEHAHSGRARISLQLQADLVRTTLNVVRALSDISTPAAAEFLATSSFYEWRMTTIRNGIAISETLAADLSTSTVSSSQSSVRQQEVAGQLQELITRLQGVQLFSRYYTVQARPSTSSSAPTATPGHGATSQSAAPAVHAHHPASTAISEVSTPSSSFNRAEAAFQTAVDRELRGEHEGSEPDFERRRHRADRGWIYEHFAIPSDVSDCEAEGLLEAAMGSS